MSETTHEFHHLLSTTTLEKHKALGTLLEQKHKALALKQPFEAFYAFSAYNDCKYNDSSFTYSKRITVGDRTISISSINTAIYCTQYSLSMNGSSGASTGWDYGTLAVTEQQIRAAAEAAEGADVRILVMHHPVNWLDENEQHIVHQLLTQYFDIVMHGHEHVSDLITTSGKLGSLVRIPAGAAYSVRNPSSPRHQNSYKFGVLDLNEQEGVTYNRKWADTNDRFESDDTFSKESRFMVSSRPQNLNNRDIYDFNIQKRYHKFLERRPAHKAEITVRHDPQKINGQNFIKARVLYEIQLAEGPESTFELRSMPNKRILNHSDPAVKDKAFGVFHTHPDAGVLRFPTEDQPLIGSISIPKSKTTIEYGYEMLECEDGVWFFRLMRFVDNVKISFQGARGYKYEWASMGGLPEPQFKKHKVSDFDINSAGLHFPYEGCWVQWYRE